MKEIIVDLRLHKDNIDLKKSTFVEGFKCGFARLIELEDCSYQVHRTTANGLPDAYIKTFEPIKEEN